MNTNTIATFGRRLKEERRRLGLTQTEFATACGVLKGTQVNYENGTRSPDAVYLMRAQTSGVDTLYLLSGQRNMSQLGPIENEIAHGFLQLNATAKDAFLQMMRVLLTATKDDKKPLGSDATGATEVPLSDSGENNA